MSAIHAIARWKAAVEPVHRSVRYIEWRRMRAEAWRLAVQGIASGDAETACAMRLECYINITEDTARILQRIIQEGSASIACAWQAHQMLREATRQSRHGVWMHMLEQVWEEEDLIHAVQWQEAGAAYALGLRKNLDGWESHRVIQGADGAPLFVIEAANLADRGGVVIGPCRPLGSLSGADLQILAFLDEQSHGWFTAHNTLYPPPPAPSGAGA